MLVDAYRSTVLNEVPEDMGYLSTLQVNSAISVVNTSSYCRGGNNSSSSDTYVGASESTPNYVYIINDPDKFTDTLSRRVEVLKDCLIALVEFIEVIRRRRYDNSKKDYNTHIQL